MATESGTATDIEDFLSKYQTFAAANGYTIDNFDTVGDKLSLHRGNVFMHLGWSNLDDIEVHQALGYSGPVVAQGDHLDDSGNGGTGSTARRVSDIGNGPFVSHHFFTDTTPSPYLYAILEYQPGQYRHMAMGEIEKFGTWTGGEFVCGTTWLSSQASNQVSNIHSVLMDGGCGSTTSSNTLHAEGLPDQDGSSKWAIMSGGTSFSTDTAGNPRAGLQCGIRGGVYSQSLGWMPTSLTQGFIPLIRVPAFYNHAAPTPKQLRFVGYFPNIRVINMAAFQPGDIYNAGSDMWQIFPMIRRQSVGGAGEQSGFGGIAYKIT